MMRILFAYPRGARLRDYEKAYLPLVEAELRQYGEKAGFCLAEDPAKADLIILLQSAQYKTKQYIELLEQDPTIRNHAERTYVIDYDDHPEGILAGAYTSIEAPFFDAQLHCSWPILFMNNSRVYELDDILRSAPSPSLLFSFVGARSHSIRSQLFELFPTPNSDHHVEEIKKWYNHDESDRTRFLDIGLKSLFCLCPRGYASYTNRIPEVMAMGRVPVVIADDWIPFSFPCDLPYYIRVAETDVGKLPQILSHRQSEARELGRNARTVWETYCSYPRRVVATVNRIAQLADATTPKMSFQRYRDWWHSPLFLQKAGWTRRQAFALRVEQRLRRFLPTVRVPGVTKSMRYRNAPPLN